MRQARPLGGDRLLVSFVNGSIVIAPKKDAAAKDDVMSYADMYQGAWGDSLKAVERTIRHQLSKWL